MSDTSEVSGSSERGEEREKNAALTPSQYLTGKPTKAGGNGFAKGNPGRPIGSKGPLTREKEKLLLHLWEGREDLPAAFSRWKNILLHAPWAVRESAERFLWEQMHGRAVQAITGPDGKDLFDVTISFSPRGTIVETTKLEEE